MDFTLEVSGGPALGIIAVCLFLDFTLEVSGGPARYSANSGSSNGRTHLLLPFPSPSPLTAPHSSTSLYVSAERYKVSLSPEVPGRGEEKVEGKKEKEALSLHYNEIT